MLKINLNEIQTHANQLEKVLSSYEENAMSIVQTIQNSEPNWHDDNSESFFNLINNLKSEIRQFNTEMANVKLTYEQIANRGKRIISFANDIFFDQTQKSEIITSYNTTLEQLKAAKNKLDSANYSFCTGGEQSLIRSAKSKLAISISNFEQSKIKVEDLFSKLTEYEKEISSLMSKIELSPLTEIDYSKYN